MSRCKWVHQNENVLVFNQRIPCETDYFLLLEGNLCLASLSKQGLAWNKFIREKQKWAFKVRAVTFFNDKTAQGFDFHLYTSLIHLTNVICVLIKLMG